MESLIVKLEKERLRPSKFIFPSIKTFLKGQKFGAVLDGMNAASARFGRFNYDTVTNGGGPELKIIISDGWPNGQLL